jgi:hypothetical protein
VPEECDRVVIATDVTYDVDAPILGRLEIQEDATLEFATNATRHLRAEGNIVVHGTLRMHPPEQYEHKISFVNIDNEAFVGGGDAVLESDVGLWVEGEGLLDAVGAVKEPWTTLQGAAAAGATSVDVADADGWRAGDAIVITPTVPPVGDDEGDFWLKYSERKIASAGVSGSTVPLDGGLQNRHPVVEHESFEGEDWSDAPWTAEVLNLTRNVVIQGEPVCGEEGTPACGRQRP